MSRSDYSDLHRRLVLLALTSLAIGAALFYSTQNTTARIGGPVSVAKMLWLTFALVLWGVLPIAIAFDRRVAPALRQAFGALAILMLMRAPVELWMLYVSLNWSPWYGIAHDLACVAVLVVLGWRAWRLDTQQVPGSALLFVHLVVTTLAFAAEIYFAHYMLRHFVTAGDGAIYFVPAEERYAEVLRVTTTVVTALGLYMPVFLWGWLFGAPRSNYT